MATTEYNNSAARLLLCDSIWHITGWNGGATTPIASTGFTWYPDPGVGYNTGQPSFLVDASRHAAGRNVPHRDQYYSPCLNALFCDGHAATVSVRDAWIAIRDVDGANDPKD